MAGCQTVDSEKRQGKALIDESVKQGVRFFVYPSVDRGSERSPTKPTSPISPVGIKSKSPFWRKPKATRWVGPSYGLLHFLMLWSRGRCSQLCRDRSEINLVNSLL
jgi:hypothetical protein